jgi:hypothetical protein
MGNEESTLNEENENKIDNIKAPEFYLNKNYPTNGNKTMEEIIKNYIDGNNDSFKIDNKKIINKINNDNTNDNMNEEQNLMTPTFNTKNNFRKLENINIFNNNLNEKVINEEDNNSLKEKENTDKEKYQIINNNKNNFINNNKTYNTSYTFNQKSNIEKKYYKSLLTKFYDPEKFDLFKIMINDQNISNEEISKFLNTFCPNVQQSVEKYYQKKYGASCLTLIYFYPNITNVKKQKILHNFSFIAATNELFSTALLDYSIVNKVRLYTDNKVEIEEINRKIKCIGALNLKNNSIITVVKK